MLVLRGSCIAIAVRRPYLLHTPKDVIIFILSTIIERDRNI